MIDGALPHSKTGSRLLADKLDRAVVLAGEQKPVYSFGETLRQLKGDVVSR